MAKVNGTKLKSFSPIHLKLEVEGGKIMDYKIIEKENFEISALMRDFDLLTLMISPFVIPLSLFSSILPIPYL